jgi:hypothetical protein
MLSSKCKNNIRARLGGLLLKKHALIQNHCHQAANGSLDLHNNYNFKTTVGNCSVGVSGVLLAYKHTEGVALEIHQSYIPSSMEVARYNIV